MKALLAILLAAACSLAQAGVNFPSQDDIMMGTSSPIGGSLLLVGGCVAGTANVPGATVDMGVAVAPVTFPGVGALWYGYVSAPDVVTVRVCALVAVTPVATAYNVAVMKP